MADDTKNEEKDSKPRKRMKKLLNNVQKQMDFYFSDVNLNHDRFLRKEVDRDPDGYVDLSTMLKFNKLKKLTNDVSVVAKAVENSPSLQLNTDRTRVKRTSKLLEIENVDARTVYVEEFPANTDHDWLKSIFSTCGTVSYISLPKYKHNNQVKGFAFIEFTTSEEAQKACQVLNTIQKKERGEGEKEPKRRRKRRSNSECSTGGTPGRLQRQNSNNTNNNKRRRSVSESSEGATPSKSSRKHQTSFSSIDEKLKDEPCTVAPTTNNSSRRKKRRSRSRSISVSSDTENKGVKSKTESSADGTNEVSAKKSNKTGAVVEKNIENSNQVKSASRKRKGSANTSDKVNEKNTKSCEKSEDANPPTSENTKLCAEKKCKSDASETTSENAGQTGNIPNSTSSKEPDSEKGTRDDSLASDSHARKRKSNAHDETKEKKCKLEVPDAKSVAVEAEGVEEEDENGEGQKKKKKNRQHKKVDEKCPEHPKVPPLHVISKFEWMTLKKEYKRMQFTQMSELKKTLKVLKYEEVRRDELKERIFSSIAAKGEAVNAVKPETETDAVSVDPEIKCEVNKEKENVEEKCLLDGKPQSENSGGICEKNEKKGAVTLQLQSGTVAALKTTCENLTRNQVKDTLSSFGEVAYVDYVDGVYQGFVRFASPVDLGKLIDVDEKIKQKWTFQLRTLEKLEEDDYFVRAEEKRSQKYEKGQRKKRKKGKGVEKLTRNMENSANHIHFS